jgi:hypothetical protein
MRRARVRPSRTVSLAAVLAGVGLISLCGVLAYSWPDDLPPFLRIFLVISVLPTALMTLCHATNLLTGRGLTLEVIDLEAAERSEATATPSERLGQLARLRAEGLLTEAEFEQKRKAVLDGL